MRELGIVAAITAVMCLLTSVWIAPWETLYYGGIWVTTVGKVSPPASAKATSVTDVGVAVVVDGSVATVFWKT